MPNLRIILIHGLNNKLEAFHPMRDELTKHGHDCHMICLPGHGENRKEMQNLDHAKHVFHQQLDQLTDVPYAVIAFSQGALYYQLWLRNKNHKRPTAQVLLSPAIYIRHLAKLMLLTSLLPKPFVLLSQVPKYLRRFAYLTVAEYKTLMQAAHEYGSQREEFPIPTKIIVDVKDEVVDAQRLKSEFGDAVTFLERPYLRGRRPGKYHIVFHPDYFSQQDWEKLIQNIISFIN